MKDSSQKLFVVSYLALILALAGCGDAYRVRVHKPASPSGIPFFAASGACIQTTVYANPYYLVTLKVTGTSGVLLTDVTRISNTGHRSNDFQNLIDQLGKAQPEFSSVLTAWNFLKQRQSFDPYNQKDGEFLLANTSKVATVVDYAHEYSLNQRKPLVGSVSADYKLSPDGTFSEVQGQVQDQTLATILGALPLSDLIKSAAGIATKAGAAAAAAPEPVHFDLEQEERMITKTLSRTTDYALNCPTAAAIVATDAKVSISLSDIGAKDISGKAEGTKKQDESGIGITGTITLPKGLLPPAQKKDDASGAKPQPSPPQGTDTKGGSGGQKPHGQ